MGCVGALGRLSAICVISAGIHFVSAPELQAAPMGRAVTDSGITSAVEEGLLFEKGVFTDDVDVSTSRGIVMLSGSLNNILAKERAVKIAESIRGVRGVIDRISVAPASRSDADTSKDIQAALRLDPATEAYRVAVSVQSGVATLAGSVGSYAEKQLVARIAKGVKGIRDVRNDVAIDYLSKRTDLQIAADVKARLQWDIWINGDSINAQVLDGRVALTGVVGSAIAKSRAFDDSWVNGVAFVDGTGLEVVPLAHDDARRKVKYATRSDSDIKQAIQAALHIDPRVAHFAPDVAIEAGEVILGGSVGNLKAKTSAEQDAANIVGVSGVDSHLRVRPNGRSSDAEMREQLKAVLTWDPLLDGSRVDVAVVGRVAHLSGTVGSILQKAEAQDVASRTKGILLVSNHLQVEPDFAISNYDWPDDSFYAESDCRLSSYCISGEFGPRLHLSDDRIRENIERGLFWNPFVRGDDVRVAVNGGVVTLAGTVGTWMGWREVDKRARSSGAIGVVNRVKIARSDTH